MKISIEATELPSEVWLGATPSTVQAFALGTPSNRVARSSPAAPSAGKARTHTSSATRRSSPASAAMAATRRPTRAAPKCKEQDIHPVQRRHAEGPRRNETEGSASCTACLCRSGQLPVARPDSTVLALCGHWNSSVVRESNSEGRHGQQGAQQEEPHQPMPGTVLSGSGESPRQENPVCGKRRPL